MSPELPGLPASDPQNFKPFLRKGQTTRNFIKFTRSATGNEWGRVTRNADWTAQSEETTSTKHYHLKTRTGSANTETYESTQTQRHLWVEESSTQKNDVEVTTGKFEDTTLSNSTASNSTVSDFENRTPTTVHEEHEEEHEEGHEEHHEGDHSTTLTTETVPVVPLGGANPAVNFPNPESPRTITAPENKVTFRVDDLTTSASPPFTADSDPGRTTVTAGVEATLARRERNPVYSDEGVTFPPKPVTYRDEFAPRKTSPEPDPKQFGGEFLPSGWGKTTSSEATTFAQVSTTASVDVKDSSSGVKSDSGINSWLFGVFARRKTTEVINKVESRTTLSSSERFSPSTKSAEPDTTFTVTERQPEETTETEFKRRRKKDPEKEIPFGFIDINKLFKRSTLSTAKPTTTTPVVSRENLTTKRVTVFENSRRTEGKYTTSPVLENVTKTNVQTRRWNETNNKTFILPSTTDQGYKSTNLNARNYTDGSRKNISASFSTTAKIFNASYSTNQSFFKWQNKTMPTEPSTISNASISLFTKTRSSDLPPSTTQNIEVTRSQSESTTVKITVPSMETESQSTTDGEKFTDTTYKSTTQTTTDDNPTTESTTNPPTEPTPDATTLNAS